LTAGGKERLQYTPGSKCKKSVIAAAKKKGGREDNWTELREDIFTPVSALGGKRAKESGSERLKVAGK